MPNQRLFYLLSRYFEKSATATEVDELFGLLNVDTSDETLGTVLRQVWDNLQHTDVVFDEAQSEKMLQAILKPNYTVLALPPTRSHQIKKYIAIAASVLIGGAALFFALRTPNKPIAANPVVHDVLPGGNKAILTLANGQKIVLDNAKNGVIAKQGACVVNKTQNGQLEYQTQNDASAVADVNQLNMVSTPRGGEFQIVLPDGTRVWLNAESSIKYPTAFASNKRLVEITGEAYFEVAKNAAKPFIVQTHHSRVEVLGTHFDVMAYDDEAVQKTTLLEGSVKISNSTASLVLKPGQQAQLSAAQGLRLVDNVNVDEEVAWKNGLFQFSDADIKSIMRQAARWYDVQVIYQGNLPVKQYTGRISRNVKASGLLNMLRFTGVNARIEGKIIYITN